MAVLVVNKRNVTKKFKTCTKITANLSLGIDVANKRKRKKRHSCSHVAKSCGQIKNVAGMRRYGSLINIKPMSLRSYIEE